MTPRPVDEEMDHEIVRSFMLTGGRVRASAPELSIETVLSAPISLTNSAPIRDREHQRIRQLLIGPMSVAEVSAHLKIPLRAAIVICSEMVAAGFLTAGSTIDSDAADTDLLYKIRNALQLL